MSGGCRYQIRQMCAITDRSACTLSHAVQHDSGHETQKIPVRCMREIAPGILKIQGFFHSPAR